MVKDQLFGFWLGKENTSGLTIHDFQGNLQPLFNEFFDAQMLKERFADAPGGVQLAFSSIMLR